MPQHDDERGPLGPPIVKGLTVPPFGASDNTLFALMKLLLSMDRGQSGARTQMGSARAVPPPPREPVPDRLGPGFAGDVKTPI